MQGEPWAPPCVFFDWWFSPRELWRYWLVHIVDPQPGTLSPIKNRGGSGGKSSQEGGFSNLNTVSPSKSKLPLNKKQKPDWTKVTESKNKQDTIWEVPHPLSLSQKVTQGTFCSLGSLEHLSRPHGYEEPAHLLQRDSTSSFVISSMKYKVLGFFRTELQNYLEKNYCGT